MYPMIFGILKASTPICSEVGSKIYFCGFINTGSPGRYCRHRNIPPDLCFFKKKLSQFQTETSLQNEHWYVGLLFDVILVTDIEKIPYEMLYLKIFLEYFS